MNKQEFKTAIEKCCEAIEEDGISYKSYDAVLEIMQLIDDYYNFNDNPKMKQIKSGELFECEGRKYIIKNKETASEADSLENGQSLFILEEI